MCKFVWALAARLAILLRDETTQMSFPEAVVAGAVQVYDQSAQMLNGVWQIITGVRSVKEMGGPVKIAEYSGQFTENISKSFSCYLGGDIDMSSLRKAQLVAICYTSGFLMAIMFTAMISTMLGLVNLFPIPMLDGGHLAFYAIEAVTQRPLAEKYQEYAFKLGFVFLVGLMLYVTYNDVISFVKGMFYRDFF